MMVLLAIIWGVGALLQAAVWTTLVEDRKWFQASLTGVSALIGLALALTYAARI